MTLSQPRPTRDPLAGIPTTRLPGPSSHLATGAHTRAELSSAGVPTRQLVGPLWTPTNRGLWVRTSTPVTTREQILRAAALLPDGAAIGGWAAAVLHGADQLDGRFADGSERPVLLCLPRKVRCRRTNGVRIFRSDLEPEEVVSIDGIPTTSRIRTVVDLLRLAPTWREGVVQADRLVARDAELLGHAYDWLRARPRWTGVPQARRALPLCRAGTESPQETRLRLMWCVDAGLPVPLVNPTLEDLHGRFLARADLLDPDVGLMGEYDGADHADAQRRSSDHNRRENAEASGLIVVQFTSVDLGPDRDAAVARLRRRHAQAARRDRSGDTWRIRCLSA